MTRRRRRDGGEPPIDTGEFAGVSKPSAENGKRQFPAHFLNFWLDTIPEERGLRSAAQIGLQDTFDVLDRIEREHRKPTSDEATEILAWLRGFRSGEIGKRLYQMHPQEMANLVNYLKPLEEKLVRAIAGNDY